MMGWFNKTPKGPTIEDQLATIGKRLDAQDEEKRRLQEEKATLEEEKREMLKQMTLLRESHEALAEENQKRKDRYNATDPWIEIASESYDPVKGIALGLDWNDAMIQYLKDNGISGVTDEDTIRKYIAFLYEDLVAKLEAAVTEQSTSKGKIADFE